MQIELKHQETRVGWIIKHTVYRVTFALELSAEELEIIAKRKIKFDLYHEPHRNPIFAERGITVATDLQNAIYGQPYIRDFDRPEKAKLFEKELLEKTLPDLKALILFNATYDETPKKYTI